MDVHDYTDAINFLVQGSTTFCRQQPQLSNVNTWRLLQSSQFKGSKKFKRIIKSNESRLLTGPVKVVGVK